MSDTEAKGRIVPSSSNAHMSDDEDDLGGPNEGETAYLDPQAFLASVLFMVLFPFSEIFRRLLFKTTVPFSMTFNVTSMALAFWVYFALFFTLDHDLYWMELIIPLVMLIVLTMDTSIAVANPVFRKKFMAFKTLPELYAMYRKEYKVSQVTDTLMQLIAITPISHDTVEARRQLRDLKLTLKVKNAEVDDMYMVNYDCNESSKQEVVDATERRKSIRSAAQFQVLDSSELGDSYQKQVMEHPEAVSLEAVADQIIWGVRQRSRFCSGCCSRFWSIEKFPSIAVGFLYIFLISALPTSIRFSEDQINKNEFSTVTNWGMAIYYMVLIALLNIQVVVFFMQLIEVLKTENHRHWVLELLLTEESSDYSMPTLKFKKERDVLAWLALRDYVTSFSAKSVQFFGQRLVLFATLLLAATVYIVVAFVRDLLSSEGVITGWTIISFLAYLFYFLVAVVFGVFANTHIQSTKTIMSNKVMRTHILEFELERRRELGDPKFREDKITNIVRARQALNSLHLFLQDAPEFSLLGLNLNPGLLSIIATGLITIAGNVVPILLDTYNVV